MINREYLIKLLEEKDGAIMDYLTCDRGRSKWLEKEREEEKKWQKN